MIEHGEHLNGSYCIKFDEFHVMNMVNKALDQIRKDEQKEIYLVKKENNLKDHQRDELVILKDMNSN
jgi:transposase